MLVTMKEILDKASAGNYAVAAPNLWTELDARAVIDAAEELRAPLIPGYRLPGQSGSVSALSDRAVFRSALSHSGRD